MRRIAQNGTPSSRSSGGVLLLLLLRIRIIARCLLLKTKDENNVHTSFIPANVLLLKPILVLTSYFKEEEIGGVIVTSVKKQGRDSSRGRPRAELLDGASDGNIRGGSVDHDAPTNINHLVMLAGRPQVVVNRGNPTSS